MSGIRASVATTSTVHPWSAPSDYPTDPCGSPPRLAPPLSPHPFRGGRAPTIRCISAWCGSPTWMICAQSACLSHRPRCSPLLDKRYAIPCGIGVVDNERQRLQCKRQLLPQLALRDEFGRPRSGLLSEVEPT